MVQNGRTGLMNIAKPRTRLEVRRNFFSVRVIDRWNAMLDDS